MLPILAAAQLAAIADVLVDRSLWIVGGDGSTYDIGFGGLDHVLSSGRNVNILVLSRPAYVRAGRTDIPGEIATALYFAAIAAAYARCRQRITKSDDAVLEHGLRLLLTRTWLDDETRFLLRSVWLEFSIEAPGR